MLRDELRAVFGIGSAVIATGAVMALAVAVVGLWALPVFSVPLLLAQMSFRRYAAVRATYRQTIASLARATEIAGYTPPGHARRVAALATAVGRELGFTGAQLTVLEYAALMHYIGQLSLLDPVADGATARLPAADQRLIALLGGAVVRRTGVDPEVAAVVEQQADPYREQLPAARIVRTVNAYDDLCGEGVGGPLGALEELRLSTGHDHQPQVVEALARVLGRGGLTRAGAG
ncbi:Metal-dependent phosphohydrolase OS=Streptomyces violarus OX=67380 GN=FHS41_002333 PE=4 SV=1 [Streptomyces violarus]